MKRSAWLALITVRTQWRIQAEDRRSWNFILIISLARSDSKKEGLSSDSIKIDENAYTREFADLFFMNAYLTKRVKLSTMIQMYRIFLLALASVAVSKKSSCQIKLGNHAFVLLLGNLFLAGLWKFHASTASNSSLTCLAVLFLKLATTSGSPLNEPKYWLFVYFFSTSDIMFRVRVLNPKWNKKGDGTRSEIKRWCSIEIQI